MRSNFTSPLGDFTIFGFTRQPERFLQQTLVGHWGLTPRLIDFGPAGHFFFYTTYGQVAETEELIGLKLGLARSEQKSPLSAQQILEQGLLTPQSVRDEAVRGNALVACFSKTAPRFSVYKTLLSLPQLFYSTLNGDLICTDTPQSHAALLGQVEVSEEAIPHHFLFRYTLGQVSYFKDVFRLLPGELFTWDGGELKIRLVRTLKTDPAAPVFTQADSDSLKALYEEMLSVMGAYTAEAESAGRLVANLLSGGVDSSIIQLLLNNTLSLALPRKTYSYAPRLASFEYEVEYARQASDTFRTEHTFIEIHKDDFLNLLYDTNDALAQPVSSEGEPCQLAVARHIAAHEDDAVHYLTIGTGADTLHGLAIARKINFMQKVKDIPGSSLMLRGMANFFSAQSTKGHALRHMAGVLPALHDPDSFKAPPNTIATYTDLDVARRCFGDDVIRQTLQYRRSLEEMYVDSPSYIERVHMVDFLSDAYENAVLNNLIYLGQRREHITPFLDEDIIRISRAFRPEVRYLNGHEIKPLLRRILEQHSPSQVTKKVKGYSVFSEDLFNWMKNGFLRELINDIDRPAFIGQADIAGLIERVEYPVLDDPRGWFLWNLLTFDIFQKRVIKQKELAN